MTRVLIFAIIILIIFISIRSKLKQTFLKIYKELFTTSIQKRLGYSENSKLLIIHADDFGLSAGENEATIEAFKAGMVNSASIMVPCRGFEEAAKYARNYPGSDLGIHLTLTSEWDTYRWGPLSPVSEVKSLIGEDGFFLRDKANLLKKAKSDEIEKELRKQIGYALDAGVDVTHLDSHMYVAFEGKVLEVCVRLSKEYKLPLLLTNELPLRYLISPKSIIVDNLYCAKPDAFNCGLEKYYTEILHSIKPGLNVLLVHIAFNNKEMNEIAGNQVSFGSVWRQTDFNFFTSDECRRLIMANDIKLITWRDIRDKLMQ